MTLSLPRKKKEEERAKKQDAGKKEIEMRTLDLRLSDIQQKENLMRVIFINNRQQYPSDFGFKDRQVQTHTP